MWVDLTHITANDLVELVEILPGFSPSCQQSKRLLDSRIRDTGSDIAGEKRRVRKRPSDVTGRRIGCLHGQSLSAGCGFPDENVSAAMAIEDYSELEGSMTFVDDLRGPVQ